MHRACKRKREDGSSPSRATCALWNRAASITARRCISHVGQTPLHAGNEIAYVRVHIYIYICWPSFVHPFVLYICVRAQRKRRRMDGRFASLFGTAHTRIPENYLFQRGVACRSDGYQTRSSDRFSAPPTVRTPLFSPLFFVGSSFLFFFSLRTPRTALFTVLFLFLFFFFWFWFWFWFVWRGEIGGFFFLFRFFFLSVFFFFFSLDIILPPSYKTRRCSI